MKQLDAIFDFQYCLRVWEKCAQHTINTIENSSCRVPGMRQQDVNLDFQYCLRVWEKYAQQTEKYNIENFWGKFGRRRLLLKSIGEVTNPSNNLALGPTY